MKLITRLACGPSPSPCFPSPAPRIGVTVEASFPLPSPSLPQRGQVIGHTQFHSATWTLQGSVGKGFSQGKTTQYPIQWQRIHRLPDLLSLSTRGRSSSSHSSALNIHNQMMTSTLLILVRPLALQNPNPQNVTVLAGPWSKFNINSHTHTHTSPSHRAQGQHKRRLISHMLCKIRYNIFDWLSILLLKYSEYIDHCYHSVQVTSQIISASTSSALH